VTFQITEVKNAKALERKAIYFNTWGPNDILASDFSTQMPEAIPSKV
jgi:hypothetical protein